MGNIKKNLRSKEMLLRLFPTSLHLSLEPVIKLSQTASENNVCEQL